MGAVDAVFILGAEAKVEAHESTRTYVWDKDEPFDRGIEGLGRTRRAWDDIKTRNQELLKETRK